MLTASCGILASLAATTLGGCGNGGARGADVDAGALVDAGSATTDARVGDAGGVDAARDDAGAARCLPLPESFETVTSPPAEPPFANTVWFDADIITESDPTSFVGSTYKGTGARTMFDRRTGQFETYVAHLIDARFGASITLEVQVNPEFSRVEAEAVADEYATVIGRLPAFLFADLQTVWIHRGEQPFGGGNNNLLIHTGQGVLYDADGVLEEVFLHEATHTSIDSHHASHPNWLAAQAADGVAISPYASEYPDREDLAETMGPYLAVRLRPERLAAGVVETFEATLPNRMKYLDCLDLTMTPPL